MSYFNINSSNAQIELFEDDNVISFWDRKTPIVHDGEFDFPEVTTLFKSLPPFEVKFDILQRMYKQAGKLVYDYNPFHNLILAKPRELSLNGEEYYFKIGDIYDFDVDQSLIPLNLKNPVNLEIQPSYDGSVNVIAYDNLNNALLVNSRFSAEELDTYRIIDRKGTNDTNLYEEQYLKTQTKLYKTSEVISQIEFVGVESGGQLPVGSYTFYFKYADQDGNETDVIAESGVIYCYLGNINDPKSMRGGISDERTDKLIKIKLKNIDKQYDYINIYYIRNSSDYSEIKVAKQYKILDKYVLNSIENEMTITISGYESISPIQVEEIIQEYNTVDRQRSMAQVQNRLFQANVTVDKNDFEDLGDLALRFMPSINSKRNIGNLNHDYEDVSNSGLEYYDAQNLYNYLGYWDKEIYRIGIVFIINHKLSPVFNIRGTYSLNELDFDNLDFAQYKNKIEYCGNTNKVMTYYPLKDDKGERSYIPQNADKYILNILNNDGNKFLENAAGIVQINHNSGPIRNTGIFPLGLQFSIDIETLEYLKSLGVDGFFFVRQKRIPNILFQGLTQGYSKIQEIPALYVDENGQSNHKVEILSSPEKITADIETSSTKENGDPVGDFNSGVTIQTLNNNENSFLKRFTSLQTEDCLNSGTVYSPDLTLNSELMSDLIVGNDLRLTFTKHQFSKNALKSDNRQFYNEQFKTNINVTIKNIKAIIVEDSHPIKYSGTRRFRGSAGEASEAWRFESLRLLSTYPNLVDPTLAVRGLFGTYAGLEGAEDVNSCTYVDIHIPGFSWENMENYFKVRYNSFQNYHAISNRYDLKEILKNTTKDYWYTTEYRGDCFVGNYTQRVNRNFTDPEIPLNDKILGNTIYSNNPDTTNAYSVWFSNNSATGIPYIEANYLNVNRSDVNQVQLGHWLTFKVCSNVNLIYRGIDRRHLDEFSVTGSHRSFYPFAKMSVTSEQKLQESAVLNKGYSETLPYKYYFINPDVPYLQDKFNNRIIFSEIHVNDSFRNGYRIFKGLDYQDYNLGHGQIMKIIEWNNNILCVFEHGIGLIPINENSLVTGENAGDVYIRNVNVLPKSIKLISDTYGSQWPDSVVKTSRFVYGIDHVAKKIWRTNGEQIELISDFKIQSFLNENITLNAREKTPTFGIRNIKSHFNAFKNDIMFTYYDVDSIFDEKKWNMCFNEELGKWVTRYDWEPVSSVSINNIYFSYDRESVEKIALLSSSYINSTNSKGIVVSEYDITPSSQINLTLKGDILEKYYPKFYLSWLGEDLSQYDNAKFRLIQSSTSSGERKYQLVPKNISSMIQENKFLYSLRIRADLFKNKGYNESDIYDTIYDVVHIRLNRLLYSNRIDANGESPRIKYDIFYTTRFWKHGQAGIFFSEEEVNPTEWYKTVRPFEFEFVVNDSQTMHKILTNLIIVSNNAEPDSITYTIDNDVYRLHLSPQEVNPLDSDQQYILTRSGKYIEETQIDSSERNVLTTVGPSEITLYQKTLNTLTYGRLLGNMHYKESYWYLDVAPITVIDVSGKPKQQRIKDKQIKIKVRYSGQKLATISALTSIYTQSYA